MAEYLYEGMFLLDSAQFAANPEGTTQQLLELLENSGATVDAHRPWQDGRLAYEIEGHRKGLHYLVLYKMDSGNTASFNRQCKLSELVIRQLVLKHPQKLYDAMVDSLSGHEPIHGDEQEAAGSEAAASDKAPAEESVPDAVADIEEVVATDAESV